MVKLDTLFRDLDLGYSMHGTLGNENVFLVGHGSRGVVRRVTAFDCSVVGEVACIVGLSLLGVVSRGLPMDSSSGLQRRGSLI
jgi:hypothetical protein